MLMSILPSSDPARRGRDRRALIASVLLHLVVVVGLMPRLNLLGPMALTPLPGAVSTGSGGGGGGHYGTTMQYVALAPPAVPAALQVAPVVPPPPVPVATPEPVAPVPESPPVPPPDTLRAAAAGTATDSGAAAGRAAGSGPGSGGGTGGGQGTGTGTGVGGGRGPGSGGEGNGARPPEPRQLIIPPEFPRSMRGARIEVTFWVAESGRVQRVTFLPEVPDRGYRRRLEEVLLDYRFRPARDEAGRAVPGTTRVTLTF